MGIWQVIWIALSAIGVGVAMVKHGEYRDDRYNIWATLVATAIEFFILAKGGFF